MFQVKEVHDQTSISKGWSWLLNKGHKMEQKKQAWGHFTKPASDVGGLEGHNRLEVGKDDVRILDISLR